MTTEQPETLRIADDLRHSIAHHGREDAFTLNAYEAEKRLRALHAEKETLRTGYDAARLEIESLQAQAYDRHAAALCSAARIMDLEAQLEAVGGGGVGPMVGAAAQPVALLVRKTSWLDGQWECAPKGFGNYGMQWADERMWVYAAPQPPAQALDALKQVCAIAVSAAKTNSRDIADWREDMDRIAAIAAQQGGANG